MVYARLSASVACSACRHLWVFISGVVPCLCECRQGCLHRFDALETDGWLNSAAETHIFPVPLYRLRLLLESEVPSAVPALVARHERAAMSTQSQTGQASPLRPNSSTADHLLYGEGAISRRSMFARSRSSCITTRELRQGTVYGQHCVSRLRNGIRLVYAWPRQASRSRFHRHWHGSASKLAFLYVNLRGCQLQVEFGYE